MTSMGRATAPRALARLSCLPTDGGVGERATPVASTDQVPCRGVAVGTDRWGPRIDFDAGGPDDAGVGRACPTARSGAFVGHVGGAGARRRLLSGAWPPGA